MKGASTGVKMPSTGELPVNQARKQTYLSQGEKRGKKQNTRAARLALWVAFSAVHHPC
jgi:hypothetical protein